MNKSMVWVVSSSVLNSNEDTLSIILNGQRDIAAHTATMRYAIAISAVDPDTMDVIASRSFSLDDDDILSSVRY